MRVCLVSYEYPPYGGGEGTYTASLCAGLRALGNEVLLVLPKREGSYEIEASVEQVLVNPGFSPFGVAGFLRGVAKQLDGPLRGRFDVIHVTFDYPTWFVGLRAQGAPVVSTVHHLHSSEDKVASSVRGRSIRGAVKKLVITYFERRLLAESHSVIAVSEFTAKALVQDLHVPAPRVRVIYNGISPAHRRVAPSTSALSRFGVEPGRFILYVGRIQKSKGLDFLLEAMPEVVGEVDEAKLLVIGEGSENYVDVLKGLARKIGVEDRVVFAGRVDNETLNEAYESAQFLVLPSLMEGMPMSILESMSVGKATVASKVGGVPELVHDGETGLLCPPGDSEAIAHSLVRLLKDPALTHMMGEGARRLAEEKFGVQRMIRETFDTYRTATGG